MRNRAQILIEKATPDLPILGTPGREILSPIREAFKDDSIDTKTVFKIAQFHYLGDEGGIACELKRGDNQPDDNAHPFICSITHFQIRRGEPHFEVLEKYRKKRLQRLKKQGRSGSILRIDPKKF